MGSSQKRWRTDDAKDEQPTESGLFGPPIVDPVLGERTATHARRRARDLMVPALADIGDREDYIEMLMVEQVWTTHTSRECQLVCAEAWKVKPTTVRDYSSAACRKMHARAREQGGMFAAQALHALSTVAHLGCTSVLPGDKSAAVQASKELLKFAGLAEPEADKLRAATLVVVGQRERSPAGASLMGDDGVEIIDANQEAHQLPEADSSVAMVRVGERPSDDADVPEGT